MKFRIALTAALLCHCFSSFAQSLSGTAPLMQTGDLSAAMVEGIDRFLSRETQNALSERSKFWKRDFSSAEKYTESIEANRARLKEIIGAVDSRVAPQLTFLHQTTPLRETDQVALFAVRWSVFPGVHAEGYLLKPKGPVQFNLVALPDADQLPEEVVGLAGDPSRHWALRFAEQGAAVLVPLLINRDDSRSGNSRLNRFTNQPHREWIYRQSYEMGRHIIGYEVQKVLAAVDLFANKGEFRSPDQSQPKIGVVGYGEGGLIAFYSAALDTRIDACLVSGYFNSRQDLWAEPIYRNVFGLLEQFGDAEIASLVVPRKLIIEYSESPTIAGPPKRSTGRSGAAPGKWSTPDFNKVHKEYDRARTLSGAFASSLYFRHGTEGNGIGPISDIARNELLSSFGVPAPPPPTPTQWPPLEMKLMTIQTRQADQVGELEEHTQELLRLSEYHRVAWWQKNIQPSPSTNTAGMKKIFWEDVIGKFPAASEPLGARTRKIKETDRWTAYDVVIDLYTDVFAWGILLLPKDLQQGEKRPVVVCQHGLEGVPMDTLNELNEPNHHYYKSFAPRLAEKGFITFSPHNPYRGEDKFRVLQRKANPLKKSLFSVILAQHDRIIDWLETQPFVDKSRIGFYGLSYGGKTAMRVPALLDRYALSICSADFNDWIKKNVTTDSAYSYMFTGEYEMPEFNLGQTFNYAEMAALIAPRPFMVERGHSDGVAPDEWVAYEFAKVKNWYLKLGIPNRAEIEFFNGPHSINGDGTFKFLEKHLKR